MTNKKYNPDTPITEETMDKIRETARCWKINLNNGYGSDQVILNFPKRGIYINKEERENKQKEELLSLRNKEESLIKELESLKDWYYSLKRKSKHNKERYEKMNYDLNAELIKIDLNRAKIRGY